MGKIRIMKDKMLFWQYIKNKKNNKKNTLNYQRRNVLENRKQQNCQ